MVARVVVIVAIALVATCENVSRAHAQARRCAAPIALKNAGATAAAKKEYARLLLSEPTLRCARTQLKALNATKPADTNAEATKLCAQGAAYERVDRDTDAEKAYKSALEKNSRKHSCGERGLTSVDSAFAARLARFIAVLPDVLAGVGLLVLLGLALLLLGHFGPVFKRYRNFWVVGTILRPRLSLGDLADGGGAENKSGVAVTARIRERLQRFPRRCLQRGRVYRKS